ncbi:hypothetical protein FKR81_23070 [Lentzea tibetensis]|uniref:Uncharacterized protein n=1 Tax=Lentzea tibetensis TaxID=2591470 RepID=A0A563ER28_9PSEU|nr:hypothetical protein [Lentzea tibetensis]TWP50103.1 hypothetical protein FKR81_23070 [Lentzea tibetensis]
MSEQTLTEQIPGYAPPVKTCPNCPYCPEGWVVGPNGHHETNGGGTTTTGHHETNGGPVA